MSAVASVKLKSHVTVLVLRFELDLSLFTSRQSIKFIQQRFSLTFTFRTRLKFGNLKIH